MKGTDYQRITEAIHFLETNLELQPSLTDLATYLGLSAYHLHRLFKRWTGVTPKDFLQALTLAKAKRLLVESRSLLETSLAVGLSGAGRLHDLFIVHEAMTPGEYKTGAKGIAIHWGVFTTPFGDALVAATERGICALSFGGTPGELGMRWPEATVREHRQKVAPLAEAIVARMRGENAAPLTLVTNGSSFQVKVWEALLAIPEGRVMSYSALAQAIGAPEASRAVGTAVGANTIAYLIPCHRVIKASGLIGDYRWGAERKQVLLAVERARLDAKREV